MKAMENMNVMKDMKDMNVMKDVETMKDKDSSPNLPLFTNIFANIFRLKLQIGGGIAL